MKRIHISCILLCTALSVVACSGAQTEETTESTRATTSETTTETTAEPGLSDIITGSNFVGSKYNSVSNTYIDADSISYVLHLAYEANDLDLRYGYTLTINNDIVADEDGLTTDHNTTVNIEYSGMELFRPGEILISVRDGNGNVVIEDSCGLDTRDITVYEPYFPDLAFDENGTCTIPDTDIRFTIPEGFYYSSQMALRDAARDYNDQVVFFLRNYDDDYEYMELIYGGNGPVNDEAVANIIQMTANRNYEAAQSLGLEAELESRTYDLNGITLEGYALHGIDPHEGIPFNVYFMPIGDEDAVHCLFAETHGEDIFEDLITAFSGTPM